jgi:hypothetical protein
MKLRTVATLVGLLVIASSVSAQGLGSRRGGMPGGTLSTAPGVGGVGVPGQVPGGTLSTRPDLGGVGVAGQIPGGTLSTQPGLGGVGVPGQVSGGTFCGVAFCVPVVPGLVIPVPGSLPTASDANTPGEGASTTSPK